jgi:hypothetical protein
VIIHGDCNEYIYNSDKRTNLIFGKTNINVRVMLGLINEYLVKLKQSEALGGYKFYSLRSNDAVMMGNLALDNFSDPDVKM